MWGAIRDVTANKNKNWWQRFCSMFTPASSGPPMETNDLAALMKGMGFNLENPILAEEESYIGAFFSTAMNIIEMNTSTPSSDFNFICVYTPEDSVSVTQTVNSHTSLIKLCSSASALIVSSYETISRDVYFNTDMAEAYLRSLYSLGALHVEESFFRKTLTNHLAMRKKVDRAMRDCRSCLIDPYVDDVLADGDCVSRALSEASGMSFTLVKKMFGKKQEYFDMIQAFSATTGISVCLHNKNQDQVVKFGDDPNIHLQIYNCHMTVLRPMEISKAHVDLERAFYVPQHAFSTTNITNIAAGIFNKLFSVFSTGIAVIRSVVFIGMPEFSLEKIFPCTSLERIVVAVPTPVEKKSCIASYQEDYKVSIEFVTLEEVVRMHGFDFAYVSSAFHNSIHTESQLDDLLLSFNAVVHEHGYLMWNFFSMEGVNEVGGNRLPFVGLTLTKTTLFPSGAAVAQVEKTTPQERVPTAVFSRKAMIARGFQCESWMKLADDCNMIHLDKLKTPEIQQLCVMAACFRQVKSNHKMIADAEVAASPEFARLLNDDILDICPAFVVETGDFFTVKADVRAVMITAEEEPTNTTFQKCKLAFFSSGADLCSALPANREVGDIYEIKLKSSVLYCLVLKENNNARVSEIVFHKVMKNLFTRMSENNQKAITIPAIATTHSIPLKVFVAALNAALEGREIECRVVCSTDIQEKLISRRRAKITEEDIHSGGEMRPSIPYADFVKEYAKIKRDFKKNLAGTTNSLEVVGPFSLLYFDEVRAVIPDLVWRALDADKALQMGRVYGCEQFSVQPDSPTFKEHLFFEQLTFASGEELYNYVTSLPQNVRRLTFSFLDRAKVDTILGGRRTKLVRGMIVIREKRNVITLRLTDVQITLQTVTRDDIKRVLVNCGFTLTENPCVNQPPGSLHFEPEWLTSAETVYTFTRAETKPASLVHIPYCDKQRALVEAAANSGEYLNARSEKFDLSRKHAEVAVDLAAVGEYHVYSVEPLPEVKMLVDSVVEVKGGGKVKELLARVEKRFETAAKRLEVFAGKIGVSCNEQKAEIKNNLESLKVTYEEMTNDAQRMDRTKKEARAQLRAMRKFYSDKFSVLFSESEYEKIVNEVHTVKGEKEQCDIYKKNLAAVEKFKAVGINNLRMPTFKGSVTVFSSFLTKSQFMIESAAVFADMVDYQEEYMARLGQTITLLSEEDDVIKDSFIKSYYTDDKQVRDYTGHRKYACRTPYKIMQILGKNTPLRGDMVLDLAAGPGGTTQMWLDKGVRAVEAVTLNITAEDESVTTTACNFIDEFYGYPGQAVQLNYLNDKSGDFTKICNYSAFVSGSKNFVTADGAARTGKNHSKIKKVDLPIKNAELVIALKTLRYGGRLLIKVRDFDLAYFDFFHGIASRFTDVRVFKPSLVRVHSPEFYLFCEGMVEPSPKRGLENMKSMFSRMRNVRDGRMPELKEFEDAFNKYRVGRIITSRELKFTFPKPELEHEPHRKMMVIKKQFGKEFIKLGEFKLARPKEGMSYEQAKAAVQEEHRVYSGPSRIPEPLLEQEPKIASDPFEVSAVEAEIDVKILSHAKVLPISSSTSALFLRNIIPARATVSFELVYVRKSNLNEDLMRYNVRIRDHVKNTVRHEFLTMNLFTILRIGDIIYVVLVGQTGVWYRDFAHFSIHFSQMCQRNMITGLVGVLDLKMIEDDEMTIPEFAAMETLVTKACKETMKFYITGNNCEAYDPLGKIRVCIQNPYPALPQVDLLYAATRPVIECYDDILHNVHYEFIELMKGNVRDVEKYCGLVMKAFEEGGNTPKSESELITSACLMASNFKIVDVVNNRSMMKEEPNASAEEILKKYSHAYDGTNIIALERSDKQAKRYKGDTRFLLVCDDLEYCADYDMLASLGKMNCMEYDRIKKSLVPIVARQGVPGCGKTTSVINKVEKDNYIIVPGRAQASEIIERMQALVEKPSTTQKDRDKFRAIIREKRVRTIDSVLINGIKDSVEKVFVDEIFIHHPGKILALIGILGPKTVYGLGDSKQVGYINRKPVLKDLYSDPHNIMLVGKPMNVSFRIPLDAAYAINDYYPFEVKATSEVKRSMHLVDFDRIEESIQRADHVIAHEQSEVARLKHAYPSKQINSTHEYQGNQAPNIVLSRSNKADIALYESESHAIVAVSRHTKDFVYCSVANKKDKVKNMIDKALSATESNLMSVKVDASSVPPTEFPDRTCYLEYEPELNVRAGRERAGGKLRLMRPELVAYFREQDVLESSEYDEIYRGAMIKSRSLDCPGMGYKEEFGTSVESEDQVLESVATSPDVETLQHFYDMVLPTAPNVGGVFVSFFGFIVNLMQQ